MNKCATCQHFFSLLPKRVEGYCRAPIPHCVPLIHRITNNVRVTDGGKCPSWQLSERLARDEYGSEPRFTVVEEPRE